MYYVSDKNFLLGTNLTIKTIKEALKLDVIRLQFGPSKIEIIKILLLVVWD